MKHTLIVAKQFYTKIEKTKSTLSLYQSHNHSNNHAQNSYISTENETRGKTIKNPVQNLLELISTFAYS